MAAPTVEVTTSDEEHGTSATLANGSPVSGEKVVLIVNWDTGPGVVVPPSGFSTRFDDSGASSAPWAWYEKDAGASEGSTYSMSWDNTADWQTEVFRLSHANGTPEFDVQGDGNFGDSLSTAPNNSAATVSADSLAIAGVVCDRDILATNGQPPPNEAGWTHVKSNEMDLAGRGTTQWVAYKGFTSAGSTGDVNWGTTADYDTDRRWRSRIIAYKAPAGGGGAATLPAPTMIGLGMGMG